MSKSKLIYVPQGCFAEITCDTPHEIIGLVTSKMSTCCHITVINDKTGYMALCHADSLTDLENNVTGVPAWIRKACPSQEDYRHLRIHVGEKELDVSRCSAVAGLTYFEQVRNSLDTCLIKLEKECPDFDRSLVSFESTSHDNPYGVVVTRGVNNSMDEHFISGNKITARQNALDICRDNRINNVEIIELRKNDGKEFEEPLISARVYALSKISTALNKRPGGKVISHVFGKITDIPDLPVHLGGPSTSEITVSPSDIN